MHYVLIFLYQIGEEKYKEKHKTIERITNA